MSVQAPSHDSLFTHIQNCVLDRDVRRMSVQAPSHDSLFTRTLYHRGKGKARKPGK